MRIEWSEAAITAWRAYERLEPTVIGLKLNYEAEGCGCALSGVTRLEPLTAEDIKNASDLHNGSTSAIPIYYEPRFEIFFEDQLYLHYNQERKCFRLSGKGQIYHPCMVLHSTRKRGA